MVGLGPLAIFAARLLVVMLFFALGLHQQPSNGAGALIRDMAYSGDGICQPVVMLTDDDLVGPIWK
jgi:hypothetical protein